MNPIPRQKSMTSRMNMRYGINMKFLNTLDFL